jgi:protein phosphatase
MLISLFNKCLVCLIGASGSGKSTFARKHFLPTEILSSDYFRAMITDDEYDQASNSAVFECLHKVASARLSRGRLTVIDATSLSRESRANYISLAKEHNLFAVAIVLNPGPDACLAQNKNRQDRTPLPDRVITQHNHLMKTSLKRLSSEGFKRIFCLNNSAEIDQARIERLPLYTDRIFDQGPFDVIGDVHGCLDELLRLLDVLGYRADSQTLSVTPPERRKAVFLGDLVDRGPQSAKVLRLVMGMVSEGSALCLPGNHDMKLLRHLSGHNVKLTHGLSQTLESLALEPPEFLGEVKTFLTGLVSHYVLDQGRLAVAHAGLPERYQGRSSGLVRQFCLYGETTGEFDSWGLPIRIDWTNDYKGKALVLYGHTPSLEIRRTGKTICLDTGCVFGGALSAWRYPENQLAEVKALKEYYQPVKPLDPQASDPLSLDPKAAAAHSQLNLETVLSSRPVYTYPLGMVRIQKERKAAALEIMSRFTIDPKWLIYLPPTMSPCAASGLSGYLEHPLEALSYYAEAGLEKAVLETKHMGSRAVVIAALNQEAAVKRFGVENGSGVIYSRMGRPFFKDPQTESEILDRLRAQLSETDFWSKFQTDWLALDCELMPWSAKAQSLLTEQYAPVGRAGLDGLKAAVQSLDLVLKRDDLEPEARKSLKEISVRQAVRLEQIPPYIEAWRRYCWPVNNLAGLKLAPFQVLAAEGRNLASMGHEEHLKIISQHLCGDPLFMATEYQAVSLNEAASREAAVEFWLNLTESGGEGMVVKPWAGLPDRRTLKGKMYQPAIKCRGREYLRIIYGPEYLLPENLIRLKQRNVKFKRTLALKEYALGLEALDLFIKCAPLDKVHECVFSILALETEPVDPRL